MTTKTSQPAGGALLISEMKEFASFPKATQRYIRRSLDVAYGRSDPLDTWARDEIEAAAIAAQARFYKQIDHLRMQIPDDSGLDMIEPFLGMLVTLAAFDLGQDRLPNFAAFRFLYERELSVEDPLETFDPLFLGDGLQLFWIALLGMAAQAGVACFHRVVVEWSKRKIASPK